MNTPLYSQADLDFVLPQPSPEGIQEFQDFFEQKVGRRITEAEAAETLRALIGAVYNSAVASLVANTKPVMSDAMATASK